MSITVFHSLTATTPDNTQYEIRPSHWNSNHVVSLSLGGSDLSGAFANSPTVTFGTSAGSVTASVNTSYIALSNSSSIMPVASSSNFLGSAASGSFIATSLSSSIMPVASSSNFLGSAASGSFIATSLSSSIMPVSSSTAILLTSQSSVFQLSSNTSAITSNAFPSAQTTKFAGTGTTYAGTNVSATIGLNSLGLNLALSAGAGGGGNFSAGISTGGNTSGNTGTVSNQIVFVGGNNVTLSGSTAAGGATVTISGANIGGAQTGISGIGAGTQTQTSGTVIFSASNGLAFGLSNGTITASYTVPTVPTAYVSSVNGSSGAISLNVGSSLSASTNGSSVTFGLASNITTALQSAGAYLTTAAQSSASNVSQVIVGTAAAGGTATLTGGVSFSNANGISFYSSAGNAVVASYTVPTVPTAYVSSVNGSSGAISLNVGSSLSASTNGSSVTFGLASNITTALQSAGAYLTTAMQSQSSSAFAGTGSTFVNLSGAYGTNGLSISAPATSQISGTGAVSVSANGGTISIGVPSLTLGISGGNTSGNTGTVSNAFVLAGGNNVTLSGSTNAAGMTVTVSANTAAAANLSISAGTTSGAFGGVTFVNSNNVTWGLNNGSITASIPAAGGAQTGISGLIASNATYTSGTVSFRDGNGLTFASGTGQGISLTHALLFSSQSSLFQSTGAYLTTAAQSNQVVNSLNGSTGQISLNVGSSLSASTLGSAITFGLASNITTALQSAGAYLTTAAQSSASNVSQVIVGTAAAGGTATLTGGVSFSNANGISFYSSAGNAVVASYTVPTVPTAYVSSVNGSSGAISLNVGSSLSASTNGSSITFGLASNITTALQSAGAYLTTAAQSNQVVNSFNGSTGQISVNVGSSLSSSSAGSSITFGLASNITTALQSAGAYLTTAAQSNQVVNSLNGSTGQISLNVGSSLSASTLGSAVTFGLASNITTALQSAGAYLTTAAQSSASNVSLAIAATNNTGGGTGSLSGGVSFSNANGLTFYTSAGNAIVGSYTVPTVPTAYVSSVNGSSGAISLNVGSSLSASTNGSSVTFGLASNITTALQSAGAYLTTAMQSQSSSVFAKTGFTSTTTAGAAVVATLDTNGLSMGIPAYITTYAAQTNQTVGVYGSSQTTGSASSATYDARSLSFIGAGIISVGNASTSLGGTTNGIILSATVPATSSLSATGILSISANGNTVSIGAPAFSAGITNLGNTAGTTGTVSNQVLFVGGNNITLSGSSGAGGATITVSGANAGGAQTAISGMVVSNTTYTSGTVSFRDGNNISFASGTGQGISITHNLQSAGAYLTTAAQSSASNVSQVIVGTAAAGGTATLTGGVSFSNANGISFYSSAGNAVVASYTVPTVPTAYVSSVNGSSGAISLNVGSSLSASTNGSSITFGLASNITTALQSAGAYLTTAAQSSASNVSLAIAATNNTGGGTGSLSGGVSFSNANGLTFYTSAGNAIVGSYTVPTVPTSYVSNVNGSSGAVSVAGTGFSSTTTAGTAIVGTLNTAGLSLGVPAYLTAAGGAQTAISGIVVSNTTYTSGTVSFRDGNNISFASGTGQGISITHNLQSAGAYLTTAMQSQSSSVFAKTGFTSTTTAGTAIVATHDTNGLSMGIPAYITTAPSTAGLISAINVSAGTTSNNLSAITFANTGNVTFGMAGSVITASAPSGGGGGVAIAASNSTFTSGTVVMSAAGGALTISNGAQSVLMSVPQTSSIVANSGVALSTNGNTIYLYNDFHDFFSAGVVGNTATYTNSNNSVLAFLPLFPVDNYSFTAFEQLAYWLWTSTGVASYAASQTLRYGLYKMDTANNSQLTLVNSSSMFIHASANSNVSGAYTVNFNNSATSFSSSSAGTGVLSAVAGRTMVLRLPFAGSFQAGEVYALGLHYSYTQTNASTNSRPFYQWGNIPNVFTSGQGLGFIGPSTVDGGATTAQLENQGWIYSASTGALPNTISTNESRANASGFAPQIIFKNIQ